MKHWKKVIGILFFALILFSLISLGLKISTKKRIQEKSSIITKSLEQMSQEIPLYITDFSKPTVLIYMNSECEHCQRQIDEITKNENLFEGTQVILVSFEPLDSLNSYIATLSYSIRDIFKTFQIAPDKVDKIFGSSVTPQIHIYRNNEKVDFFKGETRGELIANTLYAN